MVDYSGDSNQKQVNNVVSFESVNVNQCVAGRRRPASVKSLGLVFELRSWKFRGFAMGQCGVFEEADVAVWMEKG